jgi:hypothetical protein
VSFDQPILTKNELEPNSPLGHTVEVPLELKQTKEFDSLPVIGKAQRSIYSYMLTMKMKQPLEKVQFSSTMYSKDSTSRPITVGDPFFVGPPPALKMFSTLEPSIVKDIEAVTSTLTHVSAGLLLSNKSLFKETSVVGEKH